MGERHVATSAAAGADVDALSGGGATATTADLTTSTGWTPRGGAGSGSAAVDTVGEEVELSCVAASSEAFASIGREPWVHAPVVDLRARLRSFTGDVGTAHYASMYFADALIAGVYLGLQIQGNDTVFGISSSGNTATKSVPGITGGDGWGRIVLRGHAATVLVAIGDDPGDDDWVCVGHLLLGSGALPPWPLIVFQAGRASGGNAAATFGPITYAKSV